ASAGPSFLQGRYAGEFRCFNRGNWNGGSVSLGTVPNPAHPIMNGISTVGAAGSPASATSLLPGANAVAYWNNGQILVATRTVGSHDVVEIGMLPLTAGYSPVYNPSTDAFQLVVNSLQWAAG